FVALLLALLPLPVPAVVDQVLSRVAAALVPAALLGVGLRLELGRPERPGALAFGLAAKLGVGPAALLACALAVGAEGESLRVTLLEAGMPPMISAGALAVSSGLAPGLAAGLVGWGLVAALGTLPLLARLGAAWL
ncbi:MAG: AEC family transporter, partial [Deltaproteobacteria bacterium]|nr:AEC family transporter [Deltaproteobacteria bacterium]